MMMQSKITLNPAGFSLVELLIVIGALGLVMTATMLMFTSGHQSLRSSDAYLQVQHEARRALDAMSRELREADHIDTESTDQGEDVTDATRLNFQIARGYDVAGCAADAVCWGNDTADQEWVHYVLNAGRLVRCQSDASDTAVSDYSGCRVLANDAQSFLVSYTGASRTVSLELEVQHDSDLLPGGASGTGTLHTHVRLRNPSS